MTIKEFTATCFLCQQDKRAGPGHFEGRAVPAWDVWICDFCRNGNYNGVVPELAPGKRLISHLKERGLPVKLNKNGWVDIPH
jgi:hypothetical protein